MAAIEPAKKKRHQDPAIAAIAVSEAVPSQFVLAQCSAPLVWCLAGISHRGGVFHTSRTVIVASRIPAVAASKVRRLIALTGPPVAAPGYRPRMRSEECSLKDWIHLASTEALLMARAARSVRRLSRRPEGWRG